MLDGMNQQTLERAEDAALRGYSLERAGRWSEAVDAYEAAAQMYRADDPADADDMLHRADTCRRVQRVVGRR